MTFKECANFNPRGLTQAPAIDLKKFYNLLAKIKKQLKTSLSEFDDATVFGSLKLKVQKKMLELPYPVD